MNPLQWWFEFWSAYIAAIQPPVRTAKIYQFKKDPTKWTG